MEELTDFPKMPEPGGRGHALEASASMIWTLLFLAYSSKTFVSEFGQGWAAAWTILLVILPVTLAGTPAILDRRPRAVTRLLSYLLYALVPSFIQLFKPADNASLASELADAATVLAIWLPLEMRLLSNELSPTGKVTVWGLLTAALNIVNVFTVLHPLANVPKARELGYTFKLGLSDFAVSLFLGAVYPGIAVPLATATKFARFKRPAGLQPDREFAAFLGIYMSALTEELVFRGLLQNMMEQRMGADSLVALIFASIAFGLAHLRKSKQGFEPPNYRYAAVAFVSGVASGLAWRWTGKVTASAISHATGDFILWRAVLTKPNDP